MKIFFVPALCIAMIFSAQPVFAQFSPIPAEYSGTVTTNSSPLAQGTILVAFIGNEQKGNTTLGVNGTFGENMSFFVFPGEGNDVSFQIKGPSMNNFVSVKEIIEFNTTRDLTLTVDLFCGDRSCDAKTETCHSCETDCGECPLVQKGSLCRDNARVCVGTEVHECKEGEEWEKIETCQNCVEGECITEEKTLTITPPSFMEEKDVTGFIVGSREAVIVGFGFVVFVIFVLGLLSYWKVRR